MPNEAKVETKSEITVPAVIAEIAKLADNASLKDIVAKVNELVTKANAKRDRGPESKREMTDEDAKRVIFGDLAEVTHTKAAEKLELSYGQVYSCRGGFTFKSIYKEWKTKNPTRDMAGPKK